MQDIDGSNIGRAWGIVRRRGLWAVLCVVLAAGVAYGLSKHQTKKYTATASLLFNSNQLTQQIAGLPISVTGPAEQNNNVKLVAVGKMAARTARRLGHGLTAQKVSESLSIAQQGETNVIGESSIVDLASTTTSPTLSTEIANTYAKLFVAEQRKSNRQYFTSALAVVTKQLAGLPPSQRFSTAGVALQSRAQALSLLAELQYGGVQVAQAAEVPTSPSSPRAKRDTLIGALLGFLVGCALALLLERLDRRTREPGDLEAVYRSPLLGMVPESASLSPSARRGSDGLPAMPPLEREIFNLILAHLRSFNAGRDLKAVLVTSPSGGEGTTTIALGMAEAAARAGSRTLLVELDLRRPMLAQRLGIDPGPGLRGVLAEAVLAEHAARPLRLEANSHTGRARTLDVLASGIEPWGNSDDLLRGRAMATLMSRVGAIYDLVIVDAPPLTTTSAAYSILAAVDGAIAIDSVGRNPRDAGEHLFQILERTATPLLGVVANRVKLPAGYRPDVAEVEVVEPTAQAPAAAPSQEQRDPDPIARA